MAGEFQQFGRKLAPGVKTWFHLHSGQAPGVDRTPPPGVGLAVSLAFVQTGARPQGHGPAINRDFGRRPDPQTPCYSARTPYDPQGW